MNTRYYTDRRSASSLLGTSQRPWDIRTVVRLQSDLTNHNTWEFEEDASSPSGYFNDKIYVGLLVAVVEDRDHPENNGLYMFVGNYGQNQYDPADYWNDLRYWKRIPMVDVDDVTTNWIPGTNPTQVHVQKVGGGEFGIQSDPTLDLSNSDYLSNINL